MEIRGKANLGEMSRYVMGLVEPNYMYSFLEMIHNARVIRNLNRNRWNAVKQTVILRLKHQMISSNI